MPPEPSQQPRFVRAAHTAWRRIGDETVVLDQLGLRLFGLNESAGAVWHLLDAPRSADELGALAGVSAGQVTDFLDQLEASGLVGPPDESRQADDAGAPEGPTQAAEPSGDRATPTPPSITWQEPLQNAAQTAGPCAFLPGQNPLCNSAPFS